jgi:RNA-directed DNA polymerase
MGKGCTDVRSSYTGQGPEPKRPDRLLPLSVRAIASKAGKEPTHRFRGLYSLFNRSNLRAAWFALNRKAAAGVDGITHEEYGRDLDAHVEKLAEELKGKRYRAKLIRRSYLPKGEGTTRPLGILTMSDKLVQRVAADILTAIYEQDFCDFSHAYRPGRGARTAVEAVRSGFIGSRCSWVVEFDITGFYDNINHDLLMKMLERRINDKPFLILIRKWLRAGVLDTDGMVLHPATGTPQGGIISCVLANIYLHYALDDWFAKKFKPGCRGDAMMVRYADDWVAGFQFHGDAAHFQRAVEERLKTFGLSLAKEKCAKGFFSRHRKREAKRFDFLGFEFRWGRTRRGCNMIKMRTSRKKFRKSVAVFTEWIKEHRHKRMSWIFAEVNTKLRGYYQYYGVTGNGRSLREFRLCVRRLLYRWLNRRSERRSYNWKTFAEMMRHYGLLYPKISWGWDQQTRLELA